MESPIPDKDAWKKEANGVISDIKNHVKSTEISSVLPSTNQIIYLNLETNENKKFCIEMSSAGFRVAGKEFDKSNITSEVYYETPYSLLDTISDSYKHSFGNELTKKLNLLLSKEKL